MKLISPPKNAPSVGEALGSATGPRVGCMEEIKQQVDTATYQITEHWVRAVRMFWDKQAFDTPPMNESSDKKEPIESVTLITLVVSLAYT